MLSSEMAGSWFCILLILQILTRPILSNPTQPCPFDKENCTCQALEPTINGLVITDFSTITCASPPHFNISSDVKYSVADQFKIEYDGSEFPANFLSYFTFISQLTLSAPDSDDSWYEPKWNESAFDDCNITSVAISHIPNILPPPEALRRLGLKGLRKLSISKGSPAPVRLGDNAFQGFPFLESLKITSTQIDSVSNLTFSGLEDKLTDLSLTSTSITEFPMAIKVLTNLRNVDLSDNKMRSLPVEFLKEAQQLHTLKLNSNPIKKIKSTDFQYCSNLNRLEIFDNAISEIDDSAFDYLKNMESLRLSLGNLSDIDLSMFSSMHKLTSVDLRETIKLKTVNVSAWAFEQFPPNASISIGSSDQMESIDPKVGELLKRWPAVTIKLSGDMKRCNDSVVWMTYYVLCSEQLNVTNLLCIDSNHLPLDKFLKEIDCYSMAGSTDHEFSTEVASIGNATSPTTVDGTDPWVTPTSDRVSTTETPQITQATTGPTCSPYTHPLLSILNAIIAIMALAALIIALMTIFRKDGVARGSTSMREMVIIDKDQSVKEPWPEK